jgi:hypothetical protein
MEDERRGGGRGRNDAGERFGRTNVRGEAGLPARRRKRSDLSRWHHTRREG